LNNRDVTRGEMPSQPINVREHLKAVVRGE
jgi:hypothetical protein